MNDYEKKQKKINYEKSRNDVFFFNIFLCENF